MTISARTAHSFDQSVALFLCCCLAVMPSPEAPGVSPSLRATQSGSSSHSDWTAAPPARRSRPLSIRSVSSRSGHSHDGASGLIREKPYSEHLDAVYDTDEDEDDVRPHNGSGLPDAASSPLLARSADARKAAERWRGRVLDKVQENAGLCLIAGSQALFACMNVSVKILQDQDADPTGQSKGGGLPVLELIAIRMVSCCMQSSVGLALIRGHPAQSITLLGCISWLRHIKDPNPYLGPPEVRKMLALRGFIGCVGRNLARAPLA